MACFSVESVDRTASNLYSEEQTANAATVTTSNVYPNCSNQIVTSSCSCKRIVKWMFITFLFLLVTIIFISSISTGGVYLYRSKHLPKPSTDPVLGYENDTILLQGTIDPKIDFTLTVTECSSDDKYSKATSIYVVDHKEFVVKPIETAFKSPIYNPDEPSYKLGIQDYLYLLPGSSFIYQVCFASFTNITKSVTYFLFQGEHNYTKYVNNQDYGRNYSLYTLVLTAGSKNCTKISYNITETAYYFMMMHSPANVSVSYNFTLYQVAYDLANAKIYCNISESNDCKVTLPDKNTQYDILAHIQPDPFNESPLTTHFCLRDIQEKTMVWEIPVVVVGSIGLLCSFSSLILYYFFKK